jgi:hypothetical protein
MRDELEAESIIISSKNQQNHPLNQQRLDDYCWKYSEKRRNADMRYQRRRVIGKSQSIFFSSGSFDEP